MAVTRAHPLAQLVDTVKADRGLSDEDIARHARRAGHQISKQHIANLRATDPLKSLVPSTLRALAAGLELPLARIVEAALPSAGLPTGPPSDWSIEAAVQADPELPLPAKRMLLQMCTAARGTSDSKRPLSGLTELPAPDPTGKAARRRSRVTNS